MLGEVFRFRELYGRHRGPCRFMMRQVREHGTAESVIRCWQKVITAASGSSGAKFTPVYQIAHNA